MVTMAGVFSTGEVGGVGAFIDDGYLDHQGLHGQPLHGPEGFVRVVEPLCTGRFVEPRTGERKVPRDFLIRVEPDVVGDGNVAHRAELEHPRRAHLPRICRKAPTVPELGSPFCSKWLDASAY
jgi:hypothetical protein